MINTPNQDIEKSISGAKILSSTISLLLVLILGVKELQAREFITFDDEPNCELCKPQIKGLIPNTIIEKQIILREKRIGYLAILKEQRDLLQRQYNAGNHSVRNELEIKNAEINVLEDKLQMDLDIAPDNPNAVVIKLLDIVRRERTLSGKSLMKGEVRLKNDNHHSRFKNISGLLELQHQAQISVCLENDDLVEISLNYMDNNILLTVYLNSQGVANIKIPIVVKNNGRELKIPISRDEKSYILFKVSW